MHRYIIYDELRISLFRDTRDSFIYLKGIVTNVVATLGYFGAIISGSGHKCPQGQLGECGYEVAVMLQIDGDYISMAVHSINMILCLQKPLNVYIHHIRYISGQKCSGA